MDRPAPSQRQGQPQVEKVPLGRDVRPARSIPTPPPMQIITKGWGYRPDEYATAEELRRRDDGRQ